MEKKKEVLIEALRRTKGVITSACEAVNISRRTFYDWKNKDPEFLAAYEETLEDGLDYAEGVVFRCMKMAEPFPLLNADGTPQKDKDGNDRFNDPSFKDMGVALDAAQFYLERKGKSRGYSIRTEIDDITQRERLRVADLFPDEKTLDKIGTEHEEKKKLVKSNPEL